LSRNPRPRRAAIQFPRAQDHSSGTSGVLGSAVETQLRDAIVQPSLSYPLSLNSSEYRATSRGADKAHCFFFNSIMQLRATATLLKRINSSAWTEFGVA
jgi:hypothetical protein